MPSTVARTFVDAAHAASAEPAASMIRRIRIGPMPSVIASRSQCSRAMCASPPKAFQRFSYDGIWHVIANHDVADAVGQDEAELSRLHFLVEVHRLKHLADVERHPARRQARGGDEFDNSRDRGFVQHAELHRRTGSRDHAKGNALAVRVAELRDRLDRVTKRVTEIEVRALALLERVSHDDL